MHRPKETRKGGRNKSSQEFAVDPGGSRKMNVPQWCRQPSRDGRLNALLTTDNPLPSAVPHSSALFVVSNTNYELTLIPAVSLISLAHFLSPPLIAYTAHFRGGRVPGHHHQLFTSSFDTAHFRGGRIPDHHHLLDSSRSPGSLLVHPLSLPNHHRRRVLLSTRASTHCLMGRYHRHVPTLRRTPAQKRAIERIRRLEPLAQIHALLEPGVVSYLREGPGHVYFTAQLPAHAVRKQRLDRLPDKLIVKWGESSCLPRRQLQYDDCAVGRTHMWISAFHVKRRLLAGESSFAFLSCSRIGSPVLFLHPERIIHLRLLHEGYSRVRFSQPCSCGHRHREYNYMRPGGSLEEIAAIARECVAQIGEPDPLQSQRDFKI
ncbi:hypothetical protein B0H12DRAFT_1075303 [Mycena haematopus]|nr:hypothetical protein B0H12DRAFT_1077692 [Mycena haematopus]KAJ7238313.1 hypothetical protein B0H12DRAFT_1075303 [Mycena haematopus]